MQRTKIEQLTHSWNPIAMRCTPVSAGCANCWHITRAKMLAANPKIPPELREAYAGGKPLLVEGRLPEPSRLRKPAVIGVQWMGDLFHEDVPFEFVGRVFTEMIRPSQHTFQVLTKRPGRMLEWWLWEEDQRRSRIDGWWFPNVQFGITVENQKAADERRSVFNALPASVKFVSYEPALGPVDWAGWGFIDQLVFGGETGHGARPAHPNWFRNARDWAGELGIARFFKAWGAWIGVDFDMDRPPLSNGLRFWKAASGFSIDTNKRPEVDFADGHGAVRVGKKLAGRHLDGRTWNEMPRRQ